VTRDADATPTIAEALREGANRLAASGIENPRLESRLLLAHAMDCSSEDLIRDLTVKVLSSAFEDLIARRTSGKLLLDPSL